MNNNYYIYFTGGERITINEETKNKILNNSNNHFVETTYIRNDNKMCKIIININNILYLKEIVSSDTEY